MGFRGSGLSFELPRKETRTSEPKPSNRLYGVFAAGIDPETAKRFANNLAGATSKGFTEAHIQIQTQGGSVADGIFLYNLVKASPIPITVYNGGTIASIGTVFLLGAQRRVASETALFMIHRTTFATLGIPRELLSELAAVAQLEDDRTLEILQRHVKLTDKSGTILEIMSSGLPDRMRF